MVGGASQRNGEQCRELRGELQGDELCFVENFEGCTAELFVGGEAASLALPGHTSALTRVGRERGCSRPICRRLKGRRHCAFGRFQTIWRELLRGLVDP